MEAPARSPRRSARSAPRRSASQLGLGEGDAVFFLGGRPSKFEAVAGKARNVIGKELGLTVEDRFDFAWIVDFPMYERDEDTGKLDFSHNPFSMPQGGLEALETQDPLDVLGYQYDIVCNGVELSSGAVRNHKPEIMYKAFEVVGHDRAFVDSHFGGMLSAFRYGAPPHAGIAPGVDRIVMLLAGRGEHPRGHHVPDEPARRGPDDGRALGADQRAAARPRPAARAEGVAGARAAGSRRANCARQKTALGTGQRAAFALLLVERSRMHAICLGRDPARGDEAMDSPDRIMPRLRRC